MHLVISYNVRRSSCAILMVICFMLCLKPIPVLWGACPLRWNARYFLLTKRNRLHSVHSMLLPPKTIYHCMVRSRSRGEALSADHSDLADMSVYSPSAASERPKQARHPEEPGNTARRCFKAGPTRCCDVSGIDIGVPVASAGYVDQYGPPIITVNLVTPSAPSPSRPGRAVESNTTPSIPPGFCEEVE